MKRFADGQELRRAREDKCLSLAELSRISGVSKGSIGNFETGTRGLGLKAQRALYEALNADVQTKSVADGLQKAHALLEPLIKLPSREAMAARIADLERQLERANETIASQARTIEAMQGRAGAVPAAGACVGSITAASPKRERKVGA